MSDNPIYETLVDIVDENDNIVGKCNRNEVHSRNLIHRTVHVFIINSQGDILLQQRSGNLKLPYSWTCSASGHVDSGETYEENAIKETKEELGIDLELEDIGTIEVRTDDHKHNIKTFFAKYDGPFTINKEELEQTEFVKPGRIKREIRLYLRKFTQDFHFTFKRLCEVKGL